jgi:general secretion pathway protein J
MAFVADLPAYLGQGGPYLHELRAGGSGADQWLELALAPVQNGDVVDVAEPRPLERLAGHLRAVQFRYQGLDPQGRPSDWQSTWPWPQRLPLRVQIQIEPAQGPAWPILVTMVPQGGTQGMP